MLVKYISLLPEILLFINIIIMALVRMLRSSQTPKTFATISKFFIGTALLSCIVFYNLSINENWYANTPLTTLFKGIILFSGLITSIFAGKWFLSENHQSCGYYQLISLMLLSLCAAVSCRHLGILASALGISFAVGNVLGKMNDDPTQVMTKPSRWIHSIIFYTFLISGTIAVYDTTGKWLYKDILTYYQHVSAISVINAYGIMFLMGCVIYFLGTAPFHLWMMQTIEKSILPVATFFNLVLPTAGMAVLIMLVYISGETQCLQIMLKICGIVSILLGAIGVGCRSHIRQIFSCVSLFSIGAIELLLSRFGENAVQGSLIYYIVYLISIFGIYICLYGIRSHGEYLSKIDDISGMAEVKPYISSGILIFSASFLGVPPLLGMLGNMNLIDELLAQKQFGDMLFMFIMLTVLAYGLLKLIKSIYFDKRRCHFDRVDKSIYFGLFLNVLVLIKMVIDPNGIWKDIKTVVHSFFVTGV